MEPDCTTELDAITVINRGMVLGGPELLPGLLVHVPPQVGGFVLVELANPLKLLGGLPLLSEFECAHCAPQKVTWLPMTALRSPITKLPVKHGVGVDIGVAVGVGVGVRVDAGVGVGEAEADGVGVAGGGVGEAGVGVAVGVGVGLGVGTIGVAEADGEGVGVAHGPVVVMLTLHPPVMLPASDGRSSTT